MDTANEVERFSVFVHHHQKKKKSHLILLTKRAIIYVSNFCIFAPFETGSSAFLEPGRNVDFFELVCTFAELPAVVRGSPPPSSSQEGAFAWNMSVRAFVNFFAALSNYSERCNTHGSWCHDLCGSLHLNLDANTCSMDTGVSRPADCAAWQKNSRNERRWNVTMLTCCSCKEKATRSPSELVLLCFFHVYLCATSCSLFYMQTAWSCRTGSRS